MSILTRRRRLRARPHPDVNRLVIRADARLHPQQGSTVHALPTDAEHCHVFDPNTGIRFKSWDAVPADAGVSAGSGIGLKV